MVKYLIINKGDEVLDMCTGSGVLAVISAQKGAKKVTAVDINPRAVECVHINAELHGVADKIESLQSDVFSHIPANHQFDVISINLPFMDRPNEGDLAKGTMWDTDLHVHKEFFSNVDARLRLHANSRIYVAQSNLGAVNEMIDMATVAGFNVRVIGQEALEDDEHIHFLAFELTRK